MDRRPLGRTGVSVSRLCLGTMAFGGQADEAESARIYAAARDAGIDFLDCADVYNAGRAEEILGRLMAHERDSLVIATKLAMGPDAPNARGASRRRIRTCVTGSLARLGTDRIDLLYLHRFDPETPLEEQLRGLEDAMRAGDVLHVGASNFAAWQVEKALGISAMRGWGRFEAIQPMYNLLKRQAEVELLPMAQAESIAVMPYSPAAGGLLSGRYRDPAAAGRLTENAMYARRYGPDWMREAAAGFATLAEARGLHPMALAVAWVAAHPGVTAPIVGARSAEQLAPSLCALDIPMTEALRAEISALTPEPAPATDRLEERG